jgi:Tfp pilus assembly protein PilP
MFAGLVLALALIADAAEPVRYAPMPRLELQARQVDAISMLHLQTLLRGRSLIAVRSTALRLDIPRSLVAPEDLHDTLLDRLQMRSIMRGRLEVAVPNCEQPEFPTLDLRGQDSLKLNFANIEAHALMQLLAESVGLRLTAYPHGARHTRVAILIDDLKAAEILEAYAGALGMTAHVHGQQLELRMRPRPAACIAMPKYRPAARTPGSAANQEQDCANSRPSAQSRKYACEYLEQFALQDLKPRGHLVLTPASAVSALIEDADGMLHAVRVGSRLGRNFSVVTGVTRERLQLTRYSFQGDTSSVDETLSLSLSDGAITGDAAGYLQQKEQPHIPAGRMWLEQFALEDLLVTATEQHDGRWQAHIRDIYGARHIVRTGDYLGTQDGKVADIGPDGVRLLEIIPDKLGGYVERETYLHINTWYESPRAVAMPAPISIWRVTTQTRRCESPATAGSRSWCACCSHTAQTPGQ